MNIQDVSNQLRNHEEARRKSSNASYDRLVHNQVLQDLIEELTDEGQE